jgi:hypothetical protein
MKTTILNKEVNEEIDWSKPQWVVSIDSEKVIVFTNGQHTGNCFTGICLPSNYRKNGEFKSDFYKSIFQPIPKDGLIIHIQND